MNSTDDPLNASDMLKSATIYRTSEFNYVYVCYHCECTFTNIVDTLNHVEGHFDLSDVKMNIENGNWGVSDSVTKIPCESHVFETDKKIENHRLIENGILMKLGDGDDNGPGDLRFEQKFKYHEDYDKDVKADLSEFTNADHLSHCRLCDQKFNAVPPLIIHTMKDHAGITTLTCPECSQDWMNEKLFLRHLQQHIDDGDTMYDELIEKITSTCGVAVKMESARKRYKKKCPKICDICSSTFATKEKLIVHMKQHHIEQPEVKKYFFDCDKCDRKIEGTKFAFYAHQYGHLTNDDRVNAVDDEILQQSLRKYLNESVSCDESTTNKTYGCNLCGELSLKYRYGVQRHILQRHIHLLRSDKSNDKRFSCEFCGRKFALANNLVVHQRIHTLEKPYTCLVCNKSFAQSNLMKYHENIHKGLLPHQCSICGLAFRSSTKLNFHIKCHSNITTKCPICSKELKSHRLKIHIRNVHENEHRPYQCTVCSQAFKTAKTLKTHSYRHSDEKKFQCRLHCNEKFVSSSSRRAHERSKHEAH